ncbi:hypothetical protein BpHYR1_003139 [Brachionus plicatilis]|uniref:Uncharacterized protein n=1 Tax=Brachionus plicatilis TaxID=10195 RepID=A0A3M7QAA8_BRAPC|nr:hypothetical protein BpHYR1_003139 [Brachionus plicatilis]
MFLSIAKFHCHHVLNFSNHPNKISKTLFIVLLILLKSRMMLKLSLFVLGLIQIKLKKNQYFYQRLLEVQAFSPSFLLVDQIFYCGNQRCLLIEIK